MQRSRIQILALLCIHIVGLRAAEPRCTEFGTILGCNGCWDAIRRVPTLTAAINLYDWGRDDSSNESVPGRRLPRTLIRNQYCTVRVAHIHRSTPGASEVLRITDYIGRINKLYHECVLNGRQRGGVIDIGETETIDISLIPTILPVNNNGTRTHLDGQQTRNLTVADASALCDGTSSKVGLS